MVSKSFIQITLILVIIILSLIVYQKFFYTNQNVKILGDQTSIIQAEDNKNIINNIKDKNNIIEKLEYKSIDSLGNEYLIKSLKAESLENDINTLRLIDVTAIIYPSNKLPFFIKSGYAIHNKITFDTKFYEKIYISHDEVDVYCENLDLLYNENRIDLYNIKSANYKQSILLADKITFDMLTKNISINMYKNNERIKIIYK